MLHSSPFSSLSGDLQSSDVSLLDTSYTVLCYEMLFVFCSLHVHRHLVHLGPPLNLAVSTSSYYVLSSFLTIAFFLVTHVLSGDSSVFGVSSVFNLCLDLFLNVTPI